MFCSFGRKRYLIRPDISAHRFPRLGKLAKQILCIPASSASSERAFSVAGLIVTPRRTRLVPDHLDSMIVLRSFRKYQKSKGVGQKHVRTHKSNSKSVPEILNNSESDIQENFPNLSDFDSQNVCISENLSTASSLNRETEVPPNFNEAVTHSVVALIAKMYT
ncbi:E3 SUMO-protein ligase ZBED1 [Frankliniella fusca]|uniref:E3 SUMO-protein ligase ZBED1 n=1 Tax=Frankliniella fusca TaxID=407009 RepID=A0AAE1GVW3_9NEOP|nr:E3 SUMO-protein ligase ZBED1 [Frankliniella fusca]